MGGYHNIYLEWTVTFTSTYNKMLTMASACNGRIPQHLLIMKGYHIYLQWMDTIASTYMGRLP
jgi:hypothetical protein